MKINTMKASIFIASLFMAFPMASFAGNAISRAAGISDGMLLGLMLGFIVLLLIIIQALSKSIEGIARSSGKNKPSSNKAKAVIAFMFLSSAAELSAQTSEPTAAFSMSVMLFWILFSLIVFLVVVVALLFRSLLTLIKIEHGSEEEEETENIFEALKLTDNVPIEEEDSVMMDHEYDGIRELDNNLPPWWKYMFYATIIFSFIYIIRYHITGHGQLQTEEYAVQMQSAEDEKAAFMADAAESITEDNVSYLADASSIEKGAAIYKGNCATCHGQLGEGGAGPNLTDEYWIHGGGIKNVFKTIKYGVPAKGMIAWQSQFSPSQMQAVASYILTLEGTNPPNAKDPQGEIYIDAEENQENISEDSDSMDAADSTGMVEQ